MKITIIFIFEVNRNIHLKEYTLYAKGNGIFLTCPSVQNALLIFMQLSIMTHERDNHITHETLKAILSGSFQLQNYSVSFFVSTAFRLKKFTPNQVRDFPIR